MAGAGERLGRTLLRLDAAYCAAGGLLALVFLGPLARVLDLPAAALAVAGVLAVAWAYLLVRLASAAGWRAPVALVAVANVGAAAAIAALAVTAPEVGARILLVAVALEITAFAAAQLGALAR